MGRTVLVTGAAGFIGSHLAERLVTAGDRVVGLDNFCDFYRPDYKRANLVRLESSGSFELAEMDLREGEALYRKVEETGPDAVIHIAAMAGVRPSIENPLLYTEVNVNGTMNVLSACVRHDVKKLIFASSSSVYGNNEKVPFHEDDPVDRPISPYAATKRSCELIAHTSWHLDRLPVACLRFFTVFGPRQRPDLAIYKFLRMVARGEEIPVFGDGSSSRDYTFVDDIVDGILGAMDRHEGYRIYNLGGSSPVSLADLIETIERAVGKKARIRRLPMQPGDVDRTSADVGRARAELGYSPSTPLDEGIRRQYEWMRSEGRID